MVIVTGGAGFIGSNIVKGLNDKGIDNILIVDNLTNAVKQKPFSILLFDEIEKAHGRILDKFLQILEDGRLKSSQGEIIDFSETFIIFTSNIGSSSFSGSVENDKEVRKHFIEAVSNHFNNELGRPEILNRINIKNIIPFNFVKDEEIINLSADSDIGYRICFRRWKLR